MHFWVSSSGVLFVEVVEGDSQSAENASMLRIPTKLPQAKRTKPGVIARIEIIPMLTAIR